jgi:hypothetical protein
MNWQVEIIREPWLYTKKALYQFELWTPSDTNF